MTQNIIMYSANFILVPIDSKRSNGGATIGMLVDSEQSGGGAAIGIPVDLEKSGGGAAIGMPVDSEQSGGGATIGMPPEGHSGLWSTLQTSLSALAGWVTYFN